MIEIPTFYVDFQALQDGDENYRSTTRDVKRLLKDLESAQVDAVVIDLRDNGGGSLQEAKTLTGLFIDRGPTVQIRSKSDRVDVLSDRDYRVEYSGPIAVLVNRLSASASEIFAGAIQDYKRGVVIGSTSTYGKGTVQSTIDVSKIISTTDKLMLLNEKQEENGKNGTVARQNAPQFGQINLTMAKFYRVNGSSTQHKGVLPDIQFPMIYPADKYGESAEPAALAWDTVKPSKYSPVANLTTVNATLVKLHDQRMKVSDEYTYLLDDIANFRKRDAETSVSVNEATLKADREAQEAKNLLRENKRRASRGLAPLKKGEVKASDEFDFIEEESLKKK